MMGGVGESLLRRWVGTLACGLLLAALLDDDPGEGPDKAQAATGIEGQP